MSIATLKKKTQSQYNNSSVGQKQFSINGTLRNQGYVGQTMLSRSLPKTLAKGATLRGSGGCCDKFIIYPIVQSGINYFNNPLIVKPSVVNTRSLLEKNKICTSFGNTCPKPSLKKLTTCSQSDRIQKLHKKTYGCISNLNKKVDYKKNPYSCCNTKSNSTQKLYGNPSKTGINSCSEFIENILIRDCTYNDLSNNAISAHCRTPFSCRNP
jgi:hypothetical protein